MTRTTKTKPYLEFGLNSVLPSAVTAAWGARFIFPDDMLPDRQSWIGFDTEDGQRLKAWLNGGALKAARTKARQMSQRYQLQPHEYKTVTLFEDKTGIIQGNAQGSFGYLYVAGLLK